MIIAANPVAEGTAPLPCQPRSTQELITPVIPDLDFYFVPKEVQAQGNIFCFVSEESPPHRFNVMASNVGLTYIFIPPWPWPRPLITKLMYTTVQYCYTTDNASRFGTEVDVIHFFGGFWDSSDQFYLNQVYTVRSTPGNDTCFIPEGSMAYYCCDSAVIDTIYPSTTFGIAAVHIDVLPLFVPSLRWPQFKLSLGLNFNFTSGTELMQISPSIENGSIPLLRFLPGMQD